MSTKCGQIKTGNCGMIDTIKFNVSEYTIKNNCSLTIEPASIDYSTGELNRENDLFYNESRTKIIRGKKAFLNKEFFNATIKPKFELDNSENSKLYIQASLPKIRYNGNNLESLDADSIYVAVFKLQELLANEGIITNLFDAKLSRLDTFTNLKTKFNFKYYNQIFKVLNGIKKEKFEYNGTTFLFKNTQGQICIYDKIVEMQKRKLNVEAYKKLNVMRLENRFLNSRKIFDRTGLQTTREIIDNYDLIKLTHKQEIEKNIFNVKDRDLKALNETEIKKQIQYFRTNKPRSWFSSLLKTLGYRELIKYDAKYVCKVLDEITGGERRIRSRINKIMSDSQLEYNIMVKYNMFNNSKLSDLYNELKDLFLKSAA